MSGIQPMSYRRLLREEQERDEELSRQLSRVMIASESSADSSSAKNQMPDEDMSFLSRMGFDVEGLNRDNYIYRGVCNRAVEKVDQSKGKDEFCEGMQFIVKLKIINSEEQYSEAKQLTELQHSFIVKVLFVVKIQYKQMYVFSEYPDRGFFTYLLKTMRENSQFFVNNQCIQFIRQLTTGLKYLHDMNVLHGNINSKNVLLFSNLNTSRDIVLKWYDFGLTKPFGYDRIAELKIYGQFLRSIFGETTDFETDGNRNNFYSMTDQLINNAYENLSAFCDDFLFVDYIPIQAPKEPELLVSDQEILSQLGFDLECFVGKGLFGNVYKGICNDRADKLYPIEDESQIEGIDKEDIWRIANKLFVAKSLKGKRVAIKLLTAFIPLKSMSYSTSSSSSSSSLSSYSSSSSPLSPSFAVDSDEDPLEEAKILMNLSHPNVVDIYNVLICEGNRIYIVMEYLDMTLTEFLEGLADKNKRLDDTEINFLMTQLINGLEYLHQNQVIHNDIHWRNIMLKEVSDGSLIVKYVDFGCAKLFGLGVDPQEDFKDLGTVLNSLPKWADFHNMDFENGYKAFATNLMNRQFRKIDEVVRNVEQLQNIFNRQQ